ncbi:hypothetical protein THICB1_30006 [Thiomonas arsenitoxydans]|uniref:Uncharacterized protein n=1 Tax=Thiomonas arsenitoxydans (strain DSM 22701 / CIP 110005 / 3As) TaxID=426114 RepID=A0ABP1Z4H1_THIA3|nr:hypothetical protein THICB1_30006 [Thiomonas arsenitoxydans]CQR39487.1 hypothetical protein THICB6_80006 [Thiomonas arsenitoxydans]
MRRILGEDLAHAEGFDLKCLAMKQVREEMGLSNVILMLPSCAASSRPMTSPAPRWPSDE